MKKIQQVILVILDGWGWASNWGGNAIVESKTYNFNKLWRTYPHTLLHASGKWVGLSGNERGNSEVGHLNIGAGRVVLQDSEYISQRLTSDKLCKNQTMQQMIDHVKKYDSKINLMGLCSYGGIHSYLKHLYEILQYLSTINGIKDKIFIHVFTDGRDSATQEAISLVTEINKKIQEYKTGKIASICGRYYAMDRDNKWQRIEKAYNVITNSQGVYAKSALSAISEAYSRGETDEFITPTVIIDENNKPVASVEDNDAIMYFNYRSDRARELTLAFTKEKFNYFKRKKYDKNIFFVNMTPYGIEREFKSGVLHPLFEPEQDTRSLSKVLADNHCNQLHIAETEKYAHVTYFFNGGVENSYPQEDRIMVQSPQVSTFDKKPEMSATEITTKLINALDHKVYQFAVINYANADMVGHTGNFQATLKACEYIDHEIIRIYDAIDKDTTAMIITADHGNAEQMINPKTGEPDTEHNNNPVPCVIVKPDWFAIDIKKNDMKLANIAPTILKFLNIQIPDNMDEPLF